jgi:hypothetical protein
MVIKLSENYFASVDVCAYKCLPKSAVDNPLQYVISFNPTLAISNYNFSALEINDTKSREMLAMMGPK